MNAYMNGTRVFYWDVNGTIKYGTVESTSRMMDVCTIVPPEEKLITEADVPSSTGDANSQCQGRRGQHCLTSHI